MKRQQPVTSNWTREATIKEQKKKSKIALDKIKRSRKGKKFKLVPHPSGIGMIEIEIKDEEV